MTSEPTTDAVPGERQGVGRPEIDGRPTPRELVTWGALALVMLTLVGLSLWKRSHTAPDPPERLGAVPAFSLINRDGAPVGLDDLRGRPWVADFFFTRCVGICPRLSSQMKRLERRLQGRSEVRFVSFTVDPEADTPERLQAYAQGFGAPERWLFLTGERRAVYTLVREGFRVAIDPGPRAAGAPPAPRLAGEDILHSNRFVLVDAEGVIRGYYDAFDQAALDRLVADLATL